MSLLRDTASLYPHSFHYQRYDLFIRLLVFEAISSNHTQSIISQGIVPHIEKNANTLECTLSSRCFPHAVWISFTHLLCVKILIHPSHERVLNCTTRVTLPPNSQPRGLSDFCHDCVKGLTLLVHFKWPIPVGQGQPCGSKPTLWKCPSPATFCKWFLFDPFSGRFHLGQDRQYCFTLNSRTRQDPGMSWKWSEFEMWSHLCHHHDTVN